MLRDSLILAAMIIFGAYAIGLVGELVLTTHTVSNGAARIALAGLILGVVVLLGWVLWRASRAEVGRSDQ